MSEVIVFCATLQKKSKSILGGPLRRRPFSGLILGSMSLCSCQNIETLTGPDLTSTYQIYETPTGELTTEGLSEVIADARRKLLAIQELGEVDFVVETLRNVSDTVAEVAGDDGADTVLLSGRTDVRSICTGIEDTEVANPENGFNAFQITFEDSYLQPSIFGKFTDCIILAESAKLGSPQPEASLLNLDFTLFLGTPIPLWTLDIETVLFQVIGTQQAFGETRNINLDFRINEGDLLEIRVPAFEGDVIFDFSDSFTEVAVRTKSGSLCCYFDEKVCTGSQGESCDPEPGDTQLTWQ